MTSALNQWLGHFTTTDALTVRKLTRNEARALLAAKYPAAPDDALSEAIKLAMPDSPNAAVVHVAHAQLPYMDVFVTGAYMLGATLSQLAMLFGVSRSAIFTRLARTIIDSKERNTKRKSYRIPYESLEILHIRYVAAVRNNLTIFDGLTIWQFITYLEGQLELET